MRPLKTTDFDWVITVPAIWDARGKRMMREAAYLVSDSDIGAKSPLLTRKSVCLYCIPGNLYFTLFLRIGEIKKFTK